MDRVGLLFEFQSTQTKKDMHFYVTLILMSLIHLTIFLWIWHAFFAGNSRQNGERREITCRRIEVASMKTQDSFC